MKTFETDYDKWGWKIKVKKGKDITHIYLRSKTGMHKFHKRFYLRLSDIHLLKLITLLKKAMDEELK